MMNLTTVALSLYTIILYLYIHIPILYTVKCAPMFMFPHHGIIIENFKCWGHDAFLNFIGIIRFVSVINYTNVKCILLPLFNVIFDF